MRNIYLSNVQIVRYICPNSDPLVGDRPFSVISARGNFFILRTDRNRSEVNRHVCFQKQGKLMERKMEESGKAEDWNSLSCESLSKVIGDKTECPACGKVFVSKQSMLRHKQTVHDGVRKHKCDLCDKSYTQSHSLKAHKLLHTNKKPWLCWCGKSYAEKATLVKHQNVKHDNSGQRYPCNICRKEFGTNGNRRNHEKGVHGRPHQCGQCNEAFKVGSDLRTHILGIHANTEFTRNLVQEWDKTLGLDPETAPSDDKSKIEDQGFLSEEDSEVNFAHLLSVKKERNSCEETVYQKLFVADHNEHGLFECDACDLMFDLRDELKYHKLVEHEGLRFECAQCSELFLSQADLGVHEKSHESTSEASSSVKEEPSAVSPIKNFTQSLGGKSENLELSISYSRRKPKGGDFWLECDICGFAANRPDRLREHMLQHDGIRHECKQCDKTFSQWRNLKSHIQKVHEAEPLLCDECDYTTTRKDSLRLHKESKHQGVEYKCDMCSASYNRQKTLMRHKKSMHSGNRFNCEQCDFTSNLEEHVKSHTLKHHEGNKLYCEFCEASYCSKKDLQNHIASKHLKTDTVRDKRFICVLCNKTYVSKKDLKRHSEATHGDQKFFCDVCGIESPSTNLLWRHKRLKHGLKEERGNFGCEQCDFIANYENALVSHKQSKHSGLEMTCTYCDHRSDSDASLRLHMRTEHIGLEQNKSQLNDK